MNVLAHFLHHVTHRHALLEKEGIGVIVMCSWRFRRKVGHFWFRPDLDGAGWHAMPGDKFKRVVNCHTAEQVMAMLREDAE